MTAFACWRWRREGIVLGRGLVGGDFALWDDEFRAHLDHSPPEGVRPAVVFRPSCGMRARRAARVGRMDEQIEGSGIGIERGPPLMIDGIHEDLRYARSECCFVEIQVFSTAGRGPR